MVNKILLIVYFYILSTTNAHAQGAFELGYQELLKKNHAEAQSHFLKALREEPGNLAVLLNLSLTYYHLNQKGMALGYLLKANKLDPHFETVNQAINVIKAQLKPNSVPQKESDFEFFRKMILNKITLNLILAAAAITLFLSGWIWIRYFSKRKIALDEDSDFPELPIPGIILSLLCGCFILLGIAKLYEALTPRAVVIAESIEVKITPGNEQAQLFTLQEGSEVLVGQMQNDWVQVTYPGSYTGWVPTTNIFLIR